MMKRTISLCMALLLLCTMIPLRTFATQNGGSDKLQVFIENCDSRYFALSDISDFTEEDCLYARNAIFAKSGWIFSNQKLATYFQKYSWYNPAVSAGEFTDAMLNEYQIANRDLIVAYESGLSAETTDNGYISVVNKAFEKVSTANPYSEGYGALYDIDGNGVEELILVFTTTKKMSGGYDFPVKVCSLYTMSSGAVVCLIDEEELFAEAGGPSGHASVIRIDGKMYFAITSETGETGGGYCNRYGSWKLYSLHNSELNLETSITYDYYFDDEGAGLDYGNSTASFNGTKATYREYEDWVDHLEEMLIVESYRYDPTNYGSIGSKTLEELISYLKEHPVESKPPQIDLMAYTAFPESTIGTNQEAKILFSMYADDVLVPIENYMIDYSKPGVLEDIDSDNSDGSRVITFKGLKPGTVDVTFTVIETNAAKKLTITVEDQCNYFRCSAFPIPDESIGGIYVADYSCKVNENGTHDISFNAYNASYAYGVVEVYSEDGLLIRCEPLEPKSDGSGMEKVANGFKWVWEDIKDLFDGDTAFYKKDKNAKHTPVNLKNVPENAEIIITSDGEASGFVTLYTGVDVFVRTVFAVSSIDLKTEGQVKTVKELMSALVDALIKSISHDEIEGGIKEGLIKEATKSISTSIAYASSVDSITEIYQTVSNLFKDLDIDAEGIMLNVLKGMGYGVADTLFTTAVPLYKIVNFVDLVLETAWPLVDYDFNVGRGKMEIHVCKHGLQNFVANNSVTITQQSEFSDTTVLDAYVVADDEELVALTEPIVEDMSNFEVYNITLRTNGVEVQPDGDIEVRLPIPDGAVGENCVVYRIEENGTKTLLPSTYQDGFITFTTSHLSYYVVGEAVNVDSVDEPESNFGGNIVVIVMVAAILVLTVGLFFRKKAKK